MIKLTFSKTQKKQLKIINESGFTVEEVAKGFRMVWQALPTIKQIKDNLKLYQQNKR